MDAYQIAKFVHFLGVIALFLAFALYARAGARLRAATSAADVRTWLSLLDSTRGMIGGGSVILLVSGMTMAGMRWRGPHPFIATALVVLLVTWILAAVVGGRHRRAIHTAIEGQEGPISAAAQRIIGRPFPWVVMFALNGAALGVLWIMTAKPVWPGAVAAALGTPALGAFIATAMLRRERRTPLVRSSPARALHQQSP